MLVVASTRPSHSLFTGCFLFTSYTARRTLHSFPTRRSSDLATLQTQKGCRSGSLFRCGWGLRLRPPPPPPHCAPSPDRSEEHTSELQSRQYLVCRLLLEEKKYLKLLEDKNI